MHRLRYVDDAKVTENIRNFRFPVEESRRRGTQDWAHPAERAVEEVQYHIDELRRAWDDPTPDRPSAA